MSRLDPNAIFNTKHRSVVTIFDYNAVRWRVPDYERDDLRQNALLQLWRSCLRAYDPSVPPFTISATIIVLSVLRRWWRQKRGSRLVLATAEQMDANPAPTDELTVIEDGVAVRLTGNEARAEAGGLLDLWNDGYTACEAARLLGVSKQGVHQLRHQLGGVLFPTDKRGRWRFPRERIDAEVARRRETARNGR